MKLNNYTICVCAIIIFFNACKKDDLPATNKNVLTASNKSLSKTDGTITVQTGILPPVTQQSFIANGNSSNAEFQIASTKHILIYQLFFSATYPLIQSINIANLGSEPNARGTITYNGSGPFINAGEGVSLKALLNYINVDATTSGKVAQLSLTRIVYRTDDEIYHDFYPDNSGKAQTMCLVNNIPRITFIDPVYADTIANGFKQIAIIKFDSDTDYTINDLPLHLASLFTGVIRKTQLIVKCNNKIIARTDSVSLSEGSTAETNVHFDKGFKHIAGNTEMLSVYAPVSGFYDVVVTTMAPLSSFTWKDDFGITLPGTKNIKFYKVQTGQSTFH